MLRPAQWPLGFSAVDWEGLGKTPFVTNGLSTVGGAIYLGGLRAQTFDLALAITVVIARFDELKLNSQARRFSLPLR